MLIGRRAELRALERLLERAAQGRGGLAVLYGEPGIGKTHLASEISARARAHGFTVAWGRAAETGGAPAYWPWIELLSPLRARAADVPARVRVLVEGGAGTGDGEPIRQDPERERFELFLSVASFLGGRAKEHPLLLVLDDLHAADVSSLELLSFFARRLSTTSVAVVGTCRDAEARSPRVASVLTRINSEGEVVPVPALSRADVAEFVQHELGGAEGPLSSTLHELTQGNPLFVRETLHALVARSRQVPIANLHELAVGGGVLGLVRGRLAGAPPGLGAVLECAAVLGREVWLPALQVLTGRSLIELEQDLEAATERGLLSRSGVNRWMFLHVLVREAFYGELPPERRCALHAAAATALATREPNGSRQNLAAVAHHALCALPLGDPVEASRLARRAAEHARAELASDAAALLLERAISVCERFAVPVSERAEVELALGWALTEMGQRASGRDVFRRVSRAARESNDPHLLARAALGEGGVYVLGEVRYDLAAVLREALDALGTGATPASSDTAQDEARLRARLLARLAAALMPNPTSPEEPLGLARSALAMSGEAQDIRTRIDIGVAAGSALSAYAEPNERLPVNLRLLRDARTVGDRVVELRALARLACDHLECGDRGAAEAVVAAHAALADAMGQPRYRWQTPLLRSMLAMCDGRFDGCEAELALARAAAPDVSPAYGDHLRCIELHRFFLLLQAGRSQALQEQEATVLEAIASLPDASSRSTLMRAAIAAHGGEHARARSLLARAGEVGPRWSKLWRRMTADAALLCGAQSTYERLYSDLSADDCATVCSGPVAFACAPPVAGVLGAIAMALDRPAEAVRHFERALALARRVGARAHLAWIELAWGEALARDRLGRDHLERAMALGDELEMPEVSVRARRGLEATPPARGARETSNFPATRPQSSPPVLTRTEDGREWSIAHAGRSFRMKSVRGLEMLKRLLEHPDQEIHALDLAAAGDAGTPGFDLGDAGPLLDERARGAYRARLLELREELSEAERFEDRGRTERLDAEIDELRRELARAVGLASRERRAGSALERARVVVQKRVREAIRKIGEQDPELGRYLGWTVRTGSYCAYEPEGRRR